MRKKLLILTMVFLSSVGICTNLTTRVTYAQCACSCAVGCGGSCGARCSGCSNLSEALNTAAECCQGAKDATGPVEDCPAS